MSGQGPTWVNALGPALAVLICLCIFGIIARPPGKPLLALPQRRRLLLVLSDGVPMDDSTALANGADYLRNHLAMVVRDFQVSGAVQVGAVGIASRLGDIYRVAGSAQAVADLPRAAAEVVERLIRAAASEGDGRAEDERLGADDQYRRGDPRP